MVSMPKMIGVLSCGFLLCFGLSNAALAIDNLADDLEADKNAGRQDLTKKDEIAVAGVRTIRGEVLHVEPDYYLVRELDADLLRLHIDKNTQSTATISQGDRIEAKVNEQNHPLSIRSYHP